MMQHGTGRQVYLPGGSWIDYQTGKTYTAGWNRIETSEIPCVILVREGAVIPLAKLAQSTDKIDWMNIELKVYGNLSTANGLVCMPSDNKLVEVSVLKKGTGYQVDKGQIPGVTYQVK
jgi:alpha-D-xyloside xylohydrolase